MGERYTARQRVLDAAAKCVLGDRNAAYGPPSQDFDRTAGMWNSLFRHKLKDDAEFRAQDVAAAIICVKLSRAQHSAKEDNWVDIAGYAACGAECEEEEAIAGSALASLFKAEGEGPWRPVIPKAPHEAARNVTSALQDLAERVAAEDKPRKRPRVYLAGAIEHAKDAVTWREDVTISFDAHGIEAVSPADPELEARLAAAPNNAERVAVMREIQALDRGLLDSCDGVFVRWDLEAARGAGTVSEVERAACSGKPVVLWNMLPDFQSPPLWLQANATTVRRGYYDAIVQMRRALRADVTWVDLEGQ